MMGYFLGVCESSGEEVYLDPGSTPSESLPERPAGPLDGSCDYHIACGEASTTTMVPMKAQTFP